MEKKRGMMNADQLHRFDIWMSRIGSFRSIDDAIQHPYGHERGPSPNRSQQTLFVPPAIEAFHKMNQRPRRTIFHCGMLLHKIQDWIDRGHVNIRSQPTGDKLVELIGYIVAACDLPKLFEYQSQSYAEQSKIAPSVLALIPRRLQRSSFIHAAPVISSIVDLQNCSG